MNGWIKIHRKLSESHFWLSTKFTKPQAWIDLIILANHEDKKFYHGTTFTIIKRGQNMTSILQLSARWKWSRSKVKRYLDSLKSDSKIAYQTNTKNTVITILKYNQYQCSENINEHTNEHQTNTNNKYLGKNHENEGTEFSDLSN